MFKRKQEPLFEINLSTQPPSCLPTGIKSYDLIDITLVSDMWKRYISPSTGKVYDGAVYYKILKEMEDVC